MSANVPPPPSAPARARILFVDDDEGIRRAYGPVLEALGEVETASDGQQALDCLRAHRFDVIVSDLVMPRLRGDEFLRAVRLYDLDVPVVFITGEQDPESSAHAARFGAFGYLLKPVATAALTGMVKRALPVGRIARLKREALDLLGERRRELGDRASLELRFALGLNGLWLAHQPIVALPGGSVLGYEALARTAEPTLSSPLALLEASERLGRGHELGRALRQLAAEAADDAPEGTTLFFNLRPVDLTDPELYTRANPLASLASRVVLEISEVHPLHALDDLAERAARLRQLGFRLAVDDFGAGFAGTAALALLEPAFVKLDMGLVRGVDNSVQRRGLVRGLQQICAQELSVQVIAKGVESEAERDALIEEGVSLMQGFLFARPGRGFPRLAR